MVNQSRPIDVTVFAVLEILVGIIIGFVGFVMIWNVWKGYAGVQYLGSSILLLAGAAATVAGLGMWKGKNWARMITLVLAVLAIIACILYLVWPPLTHQVGGPPFSVLPIVIAEIVVIRNLLRSKVKVYFDR